MWWSRYDDIFLVGPWQPLTIGLMPCRFLWIFLVKYNLWVFVSSGGLV